MPYTRPSSLDDAVARLKAGNDRFVQERPQAPVASAERIELASGQNPWAVVLGCSDSRVPIETIFDQPPGNLFVVRLAGNVVTDEGLASIEYGTSVLSCMIVVVLGHASCGAVAAAIQHVESGTAFPGHIDGLVRKIAPAAESTRTAGDTWAALAVRQNVRNAAAEIEERSPVIREAVAGCRVRVVRAVYDLHTGRVDFFD